ncbi:hypothetical protein SLEP1_g24433 [Rubroshorea leprosula]|uniref:Uncharacterized protein n=1 Tax=Rubroshorea leprosula TaxID=152421 RepID=A0AAV5JPG3_9ROSI|nr:hypothetical protein SLEP1_g24433 [Rubroshorea leprosula]
MRKSRELASGWPLFGSRGTVHVGVLFTDTVHTPRANI